MTTRHVLLAALLLAACTGTEGGKPKGGSSTAREEAPELKGRTLGGERFTLSEHRGKVVLLNVWAQWCKPCKKELPELQRLHKKHEGDGLVVLGVSVDKVRAYPLVRGLVNDHGLTYPIVLDPDGKSVEAYGVHGYPTNFVIGRDGTIRWRRDGMIKDNDGELEQQLRLALDEKS